MLFFADVISARRFSFPGLLWRSPNEPPLTHSFGNVFGITPGVTWLVITVLCAYILIYIRHYFVFSVLSLTIPASAICSNGVSTFERAFFLNCSTALFCTSHYKRKKMNAPSTQPQNLKTSRVCSVISVR
jgi:hypothetical protein